MVNNIIEIRVTGKGTDLNPNAGSGGGSSGGLLAAGGKLGMIAGAAIGIFTILKDMLWVFKPIMTILKQIARTLGLFLQPIAELLFLLIRPLLDFIRPLAMLFRAMFMPVMGLLREYSAVMSHQMSSGDIAGATQTGFDMIGLALGGFFIALANVVGQVLISLIGNLLETLTNGLIDGIVLILNPLMVVIDKVFRTDLADALLDSAENLKNNVSASFKNGINSASEALHLGTSTMMQELVNIHTEKLTTLKRDINIIMPEIVEPQTEAARNTADSVSSSMMTMSDNTALATNSMRSTIQSNFSLFGGTNTIPGMFSSGLIKMRASVQVFTEDMEKYARRARSALSSAESAASRARSIEFNLIRIGSG